jgi:hypothetical protein
MNFFAPERSVVRRRRWFAGAFLLGVGALMTAPLLGAIFKNGFVDHSICCASGGPLSFDGTPARNPGASLDTNGFQHASLGLVAGNMPAPQAVAEKSEVPAGPPKEVDGHLQIEFARLSDFKVEAPAYDPAVKQEEALAVVDKQIPDEIKRFDGRRAQITGFMLPVKMEGQLVSQFLLMRDQMMCCYGVVPRMNDWVVVYAAKPVRYTPDVPISFRGKLQVKAMQEQGFITGIYLLEEAVPGK